jgi:hypothetical protein
MITPNLPKYDSPKEVYSLRVYKTTMDKLGVVQEKTGIRTQDLIRIAINNFLDSDEVANLDN